MEEDRQKYLKSLYHSELGFRGDSREGLEYLVLMAVEEVLGIYQERSKKIKEQLEVNESYKKIYGQSDEDRLKEVINEIITEQIEDNPVDIVKKLYLSHYRGFRKDNLSIVNLHPEAQFKIITFDSEKIDEGPENPCLEEQKHLVHNPDDKDKSYLYFYNRKVWAESEASKLGMEENHTMRMVFNVKPERILHEEPSSEETCVAQKITTEILPLNYVRSAKYTISLVHAANCHDNVIIYFLNPPGSGNLDDLIKRVRNFAKDTRPGHAPVLQPIDSNIPGIAYADECAASDPFYERKPKYGGFGSKILYRVIDAIVDIMKGGKKTPFETVMQRVEEKLTNHQYPIDTENPYMCSKHAKTNRRSV